MVQICLVRENFTGRIGEAKKIQSSNLDGTNITDLATGLNSLKGDVALDLQNDKVYWIDRGTGFLQKANLDGSNIQTIATGIGSGGRGLDLDVSNGHVYYGDYSNNNIKRANLDGSGVITVLSGLGGNRGHLGFDKWKDLLDGKYFQFTPKTLMVLPSKIWFQSYEKLSIRDHLDVWVVKCIFPIWITVRSTPPIWMEVTKQL